MKSPSENSTQENPRITDVTGFSNNGSFSARVLRAVAYTMAWFLRRLPYRLKWFIGRCLGWLWWTLKLRRFTLLKNVSLVFPKASKLEKINLVKRSLSYLGYQLVEVLQAPALDQRWLRQDVEFRGVKNFESARAQKKGVLLLSLHLGCGDVGVAALSLKGIPIHLITKTFKSKIINDVWFTLRSRQGAKFINAHGSRNAFEILQALKTGAGVVFVFDQYMGPPYGINVEFFGRATGTAYGLSLFALKTRCPVVPVYSYREGRRTIVEFGEQVPVELIENENREQAHFRLTRQFNQVIEKIIVKHPDQWMWVHRRWKEWG